MLVQKEKYTYLSNMLQNIKRYVGIFWALIIIFFCFTGCGTQPLAEKEIDEIVINTYHYAREVPEITVSITDEETIEEIVLFFDTLEYRENPDGRTPDDLIGAGKDIIYFKKDGKVVKQFTIKGSFIIDQEEIDSDAWDYFTEDCWVKWDGYVNEIVLGQLGTLVEE